MPRGPFAPFLHYVRSRRRSADSDANLLNRFAADRDEDAFAELVRRHGPLVWGVARQVLGHDQDAEDAFQATFLLLARNAKSVRTAAAVAGWLHGTAWRVATKARVRANARRQREKAIPRRPNGDVTADVALRELQALLHAEIAALPAKYRTPFVLCVLEGRSRAEVARSLGWNEGTLSTRLAWARNRLRSRLLRRGVDVAAALAAVEVTRAAIPAALATSVVTAARTGVVSAAISALAHAGVMTTKLAQFAALGLVLGGIAVGSAGLMGSDPPAAADQSKGKASAPAAAPPTVARQNLPMAVFTLSGNLTGPDGKPVSGAKVTLRDPFQSKSLGTVRSDGKGHYELHDVSTVVPYLKEAGGLVRLQVIATAPGLGFAWSPLFRMTARPDPRFAALVSERRLVAAPQKMDLEFAVATQLRGWIMDGRGRPVAGASVQIAEVNRLPHKNEEYPIPSGDVIAATDFTRFAEFTAAAPEKWGVATAGRDGLFHLDGLPRHCLLWLTVEHPDYAKAGVFAVTSGMPLPGPPAGQPALVGDVGVSLTKPQLVPMRVISAATGKPLGSVSVRAFTTGVQRVEAAGKTGSDGQVSLKLPPGEYTADIFSDSESVTHSGPMTVPTEAAHDPQTIRVTPACVVHVQAVDADSGRALEGITFRQQTSDGYGWDQVAPATGGLGGYPTLTGGSGEFLIVVRPGKRRIEIDMAARKRFEMTKGPTEPIELPAGGEVMLRFELRKK